MSLKFLELGEEVFFFIKICRRYCLCLDNCKRFLVLLKARETFFRRKILDLSRLEHRHFSYRDNETMS